MTTLAWIIVLICVAITVYLTGCHEGQKEEAKNPKCIQVGQGPYNPFEMHNPPPIDWKKRYQDVQEMRERAVGDLINTKVVLHNLEVENKQLKEQVRDLQARLEITQDGMNEANKRNRELETEIKELKADIQERYEQAKEVHVWVKDQSADFNNLRDVAVKLEQENERLREKLGMASLAPSANKPAPEPHTKPNI